MTDPVRERHGQLVSDCKVGDCFRASMSYLLNIPNSHDLPNHDEEHPFISWWRLLWPLGLTLSYDTNAFWHTGLWIASVPSKNCPGATHAIVMRDCKVEFDPSSKRRYHRGWSLLGKGLVRGGYSLRVHDSRMLGVNFSDAIAKAQSQAPS